MDSGAAYESPSAEGQVRIAGEGTVNEARGIVPQIRIPYLIEIITAVICGN
jgi:hypothetical protein